jgi:hypothetical protein
MGASRINFPTRRGSTPRSEARRRYLHGLLEDLAHIIPRAERWRRVVFFAFARRVDLSHDAPALVLAFLARALADRAGGLAGGAEFGKMVCA